MFAFIVSISDGSREHIEEGWPQVTATIERCSVDPYIPLRSASRTAVWHISCRIHYAENGDQIQTGIRSRSTGSGWGGDAERMRQWVVGHPSGSPIVVRYDPANPTNAVLTETDMPSAGPRTPNNLKLLLIASVASLTLITIAKRFGQGQ